MTRSSNLITNVSLQIGSQEWQQGEAKHLLTEEKDYICYLN